MATSGHFKSVFFNFMFLCVPTGCIMHSSFLLVKLLLCFIMRSARCWKYHGKTKNP